MHISHSADPAKWTTLPSGRQVGLALSKWGWWWGYKEEGRHRAIPSMLNRSRTFYFVQTVKTRAVSDNQEKACVQSLGNDTQIQVLSRSAWKIKSWTPQSTTVNDWQYTFQESSLSLPFHCALESHPDCLPYLPSLARAGPQTAGHHQHCMHV